MHLLLSLLVIISAILCVESFAQTTSQSPQTLQELQIALSNLGLDIATDSTSTDFSDASSCTSTCRYLTRHLSSITSEQGDQTYDYEQSRYWSNQQLETGPLCRVSPANASEVAAALLITTYFNCSFAVKSGGHAAFAGASNIQGGVTIDLLNLNEVQTSEDQTMTRVGAGNTWIDVYEQLVPHNLSVVGGRVAAIGVGGLTLGGGISFFSGRYGWACDGVRNYEVVLANGTICNVNYASEPDLYFALRGGGNNFGIVTRFDLETFPQGDMWGGMMVYNSSANASIYQAFNNFANNAHNDPDAALITCFVLLEGQYIFSNDYEYAKPVANPPIFQDFTSIPHIADTTRITNLSDLALELNASNPGGLRETYTTSTFKNSPDLQIQIMNMFVEEMNGVGDAAGILPALCMQPITQPMVSHFSQNGGNALGIEESDAPLMLMDIAIMWSDTSDDDRIIAASDRVIANANAAARSMGLDYKYIYQNYASLGQSVFASYGATNQQRLIDISKAYDPKQIFQKLQPGYFKLSGVNGGSPT